jgi:hypothetical protein
VKKQHKEPSDNQDRRTLKLTARRTNDPFASFASSLSGGAKDAVTHYGKSQQPRPRRWFIVEVPDFGKPVLHRIATFAEVRAKLAELTGAAAAVFVFYGHQALLTKGDPRRVIHPNGMVYKLVPDSETIVIDEEGRLSDIDLPDDADDVEYEYSQDDDE